MFRLMADASVVRHDAHSQQHGGPNELETTENGRGGSLLLLVGVVVEPARPADELVHSDGNGPPLEEMKITARIKLRG